MFFSLLEIFQPNFGGNIPQLLSQFDGGVGHIVAAALQTKGIIDQAKILENLTELNSIASLFYLFAIAMAVGSVAVFGNYRQSIYFLIGPALYTFMVTTTVDTDGVKAKMGSYEIPNSIGRQTEFLKHIRAIDDNGGTKKVSLAYALVDGMATEVVQEVTQLLVNTSNRDHLRFVARERALSFLLLELPTDGPLPLLVSRHQAECSEAIRNYIQSGVDTKRDLNAMSIARSDADVAKIKAAGDKAWKEEFGMNFVTGADVQIKRYLKAMSGQPGFGNIGINNPEDAFRASCKDVWQWIGASFKLRAEKAFEENYKHGSKEKDIVEPPVNDQVRDAISVDYLAANMYRNTIYSSSNSQLQAQMFQNSPINQQDLSAAFTHHPGAHARGGYFGMKYFANSIPYIQGLILYLLSIGFPFFAVLLVMPGKAMNFMIWVSLWVWVKSWDIGFALVLVCKDMFWHILKHRYNNFDQGGVDWADPSSVFSIILNNDPLATQNLYFELSSFLTVSVPFLTAHFCLGATGMFEMFRNSIDQTSQRFRTWEQKSGTRERLNLVERETAQLEAALSEHGADRAQQKMSTGMLSNGKFISGRGAQDNLGRAIGRDTREAYMSGQNSGMVANATNRHLMTAYNLWNSHTKLGNDEWRAQFSKEMAQLDSFEDGVNMKKDETGKMVPLPDGTALYNIPAGFKEIGPTKDATKTTLEQNVPQDVLLAHAAAEKKHNDDNKDNKDKQRHSGIDVNQPITWKEFITRDAQSRGERVVLPHAFRGMDRMEAGVTIEELRKLDKNVGTLEMVPGGSEIKALVARGEKIESLNQELAGLSEKKNKTASDEKREEEIKQQLQGLGPITVDDVIDAGHRDYKNLVDYTGALSGRHYAPQIQSGFVSMKDAVELSAEIGIKGRFIEVGSGGEGVTNNLSNPLIKVVNDLIRGNDTERDREQPGLDGKGP